jgi:vacuolar-type H+-ATPase subunit I/STV1
LSIIKKTALYFAQKDFCRAAINEHADLSVFKEKLSSTVFIGLILITISYILGIPAVFIVGLIAVWMKNPTLGVFGIPFIYGLSWLLLILGLYLAGPKYGKAFNRWTVRVILEKILGDEVKKVRPLPHEVSQSDITKN